MAAINGVIFSFSLLSSSGLFTFLQEEGLAILPGVQIHKDLRIIPQQLAETPASPHYAIFGRTKVWIFKSYARVPTVEYDLS